MVTEAVRQYAVSGSCALVTLSLVAEAIEQQRLARVDVGGLAVDRGPRGDAREHGATRDGATGRWRLACL